MESTAPFERPVVPPVYWKKSDVVAGERDRLERQLAPSASTSARRSVEVSRGSTAGEGMARPLPSPRSSVITVLTGSGR